MPQPRKSNTTRTVLIVIASVVALCCIAGAVIGFVAYRGVKTTIDPARDATRVFVNDLQTSQLTDAYNHLCGLTQASFSPPVFEAYVQAQPRITGYKFTGFSLSTVNGKQTATVTADLTLDGGAIDHHSFLLSHDSGQWLVCGQPY